MHFEKSFCLCFDYCLDYNYNNILYVSQSDGINLIWTVKVMVWHFGEFRIQTQERSGFKMKGGGGGQDQKDRSEHEKV